MPQLKKGFLPGRLSPRFDAEILRGRVASGTAVHVRKK